MIEAARVAGVGLATEARIRESEVPAVIFRNALYLDTLPVSLGGATVVPVPLAVRQP